MFAITQLVKSFTVRKHEIVVRLETVHQSNNYHTRTRWLLETKTNTRYLGILIVFRLYASGIH